MEKWNKTAGSFDADSINELGAHSAPRPVTLDSAGVSPIQ